MSVDSTPPPSPLPGGGGGLIHPTVPPKEPLRILLLNLFLLGGVGSIVLGQKTKGIVIIVIGLVAGWPTCGLGALLVGIFGAVDGYRQALQLQAGHPVGEWTFFDDHR